MVCYHMTSISNINSIARSGLIPLNGDNGKLIGETKTKVYFSEGFAGAIALYVDFNIVFEKIKNGILKVVDKQIENKVVSAKDLKEYLGFGVYLCFEGEEIKNERNFENGCTDQIISPEKLYVCGLRDKETRKVNFSRFDIIHYMMAQTRLEDIIYYGATYENSPDFAEATKHIQSKVEHYYKHNKEEIIKYACGYELEFIALSDFLNKYEI